MKQPYTRKMTFNERAFVASNLIFNLVFDGEGILDPERWNKAVSVASEANPGTRLILKGHLGRSRWIDSGKIPRIREVDGSGWDGLGLENAPAFFRESLSYREGPTCEIILIRGPIPRVVFRSHHGVCDARGILFWAEDIFRALRGETVVGATSNMTDVEMCRSFQDQYRTPFPTEHIAPTGRPKGNACGVTWRHRSLKGKIPHLLSRCARLVAEEAWRHGEGVVRFGIPVDMRRRKPGLNSTGNLSFALYIEVKKDTTPDEIERDIALQVSHGDEGRLTRGDELLENIPMCLVKRMATRIIDTRHRRGIYSLSGILTNVGRVDLNRFHGGGFAARAFWAVPPDNEYYPLILVMTGYEGGSDLVLSMPGVLAGEGRIEDALARMVRGLERTESRV